MVRKAEDLKYFCHRDEEVLAPGSAIVPVTLSANPPLGPSHSAASCQLVGGDPDPPYITGNATTLRLKQVRE